MDNPTVGIRGRAHYRSEVSCSISNAIKDDARGELNPCKGKGEGRIIGGFGRQFFFKLSCVMYTFFAG